VTAWFAVLAVGAGSFAFRWVPLVLAGRRRVTPAAEATLRHASLAAVTALAVGGATAPDLTSGASDVAATVAALAVAGAVAWTRRPMVVVLASGLLTWWAVLAAAPANLELLLLDDVW
jgi:branched-subunit amino acid transport protein